MRYEQGCHGILLPKRKKDLLHRLAHNRIKCRERLIHQQQIRGQEKYARKPHTLLLPAREFVRIAIHECRQSEIRDKLIEYHCLLRLPGSFDLRAEQDILTHRLPSEQTIVLRQKANAQRTRIYRHSIRRHHSRRRTQEPRSYTQQRRLSAARGTDQREHFPVPCRKRGICKRMHSIVSRSVIRVYSLKAEHIIPPITISMGIV